MSDGVTDYQLRDSNGPMLEAALAQFGCPPVFSETVRDTRDAIAAALLRAIASADVVVVTGGVSVGKYDLVPEALEAAGGVIRFHGVAMKPGRPQLFATAPDGTCVFGLPGNPLSVLSGLLEFVLPTLRRLSGRAPQNCRPGLRVRLLDDIRRRKDREHLVPARLLWEADGVAARIVRGKGSADLAAAARADGVVQIPAGEGTLPAGSMVRFLCWGGPT